MAVGDEATAAGLSVEPATADVRQGYVAINKRGDELARHLTSGTHPFTRITGQAQTSQLADSAVATAKIANSAVTADKIATDAVSTPKIRNSAVSNAKIATNAVDGRTLAKRYAAGVVNISSITGVTVETGLSGTVAMTVTSRAFVGTFYAVPQNTTGRFLVRAAPDNESAANTVSWIAMEV